MSASTLSISRHLVAGGPTFHKIALCDDLTIELGRFFDFRRETVHLLHHARYVACSCLRLILIDVAPPVGIVVQYTVVMQT